MAGRRIGKVVNKSNEDILHDIEPETDINLDNKSTVGTENGKSTVETEDIPLITKQSTDSKIKIDFLNDDETKSFISEPTKTATVEDDAEKKAFSFSDKKPDEVREQVKKEEGDYAKELTVEDFQEVAEFFIDLLDFGVVSAARFISKENTDQPFEVSEKKKNKLIKQLTLIAIKHKMKIGIELLFLGTAIMVYAAPLKKAFKMRREKNLLEKTKADNGIKTKLG